MLRNSAAGPGGYAFSMGLPEYATAFEDPSIDEFCETVATAASDELEVQAMEGGFMVFYREKLPGAGIELRFSSSYLLVVKCDPLARSFTMEDQQSIEYGDLRSLNWGKQTRRGRVIETRYREVRERQGDGSFKTVESVRQSTRALHAAVRGPAAALGWTEKQPLSAKIGIVAGIIGGVGALFTVVALAVVAISGGFS